MSVSDIYNTIGSAGSDAGLYLGGLAAGEEGANTGSLLGKHLLPPVVLAIIAKRLARGAGAGLKAMTENAEAAAGRLGATNRRIANSVAHELPDGALQRIAQGIANSGPRRA